MPGPKPAAFDDFNLPVAERGTPKGVLFGTRRIKSPNVVYYGNLRTEEIRAPGGKK